MGRAQFWSLLCVAIVTATAAIPGDTKPVLTFEPLQSFKECDVCPDMMVLPTGRFMMGSTLAQTRQAQKILLETRGMGHPNTSLDQENVFLNEQPSHEVEIDRPIAIGINEVTRAEWSACIAEGHCTDEFEARIRFRLQKGPYQDDPRSPIAAITFHEMQAYVAWLNTKVGADAYRLPTEAEWEYAARAGTTTMFAQGETLTRAQANFGIHWAKVIDGKVEWHHDSTNERRPIPVDLLDAANPWGLRHMAGNVSEMTRTCMTDRHPAFRTSSRYLAASVRPFGCRRAVKGGFYLGAAILARPARRTGRDEDSWSPWLGFRLVRELDSAATN